MGTKIVARGSLAPWDSKVVVPVNDKLEGWFTFDTDARRLAVNRAIGKPNGSVSGTPTIFPGYARFTGKSNWVQTEIDETEDMTMIVVCRAVAPVGTPAENATNPFYVGNYDTPPKDTSLPFSTLYGASIYTGFTQSITATGTRYTDANQTAITSAGAAVAGAPETNWALYSSVISDANGTTSKNHTTGISAHQNNHSKRLVGSRKMRIGSAYRDFGGQCDISFVGFYSKALSPDELERVIVPIRKRLARLGIAA
jgi:hypothetical protein